MATGNLSAFLRRLKRGMAAEALGQQSDRQLGEQFLAERDEAAFEALMRRHGPMVYRVCWRVLQHAEDAEDAFQATFLLLARKFQTIRKYDSLASWLHGVAHRTALKSKAQAAQRRRREQKAAVAEVAPADELTWKELRTALDAELAKMSEKWRLPLILCYLEGRTQDEAAGQLGWGKNTLRRRLQEAREALGRRLTRRGVAFSAALCAPLLSDCAASAAVSPKLLACTVEAAVHIAAGGAAAGIVPAKVAALTEGVLRAMLLTRFKIAALVLITACALAYGAAKLMPTASALGQSEGKKETAPKMAPPPMAQTAKGDTDATLAEAVQKSLARFAELKTLSVTWSEQHQQSAFARAKQGRPNVADRARANLHYLVWQGGKMYTRRIEGGREWKDGPHTRRNEFAFDGRILAGGCPDQLYNGKSRSPGLLIDLAEAKEPDADYFGVEHFQPIGIRLPHGAGELLRVKQLVSQLSFLLEHGGRLKSAGQKEIDHRPMVQAVVVAENPMWRRLQKTDLAKLEDILRSSRTNPEEHIQKQIELFKRRKEVTPRMLQFVFHLDPEFGFAVRRWQELAEDGRLRVQSDCTAHEKLTGHEIWLPRKCRTDYYISDGDYPGEIFETPFHTYVLEVSAFGTKPVPGEQFVLNYTVPGSNITDNTLPEAKLGRGGVSYKVPPHPEDLNAVIQEAREETRERGEAVQGRNLLKPVLVIGMAASD